MKKSYFYMLVMAAGIFAFTSCGQPEQATEEAEAATEEVEATMEESAEEAEAPAEEAELVEHVCSDECTAEACHMAHGEVGHECSDACAAEGHEHGEGEEHSQKLHWLTRLFHGNSLCKVSWLIDVASPHYSYVI